MSSSIRELGEQLLRTRGVDGIVLSLEHCKSDQAPDAWQKLTIACASVLKMTEPQQAEFYDRGGVRVIFECLPRLHAVHVMAATSAISALIHTHGQYHHVPRTAGNLVTDDELMPRVLELVRLKMDAASIGPREDYGISTRQPLYQALRLFTTRAKSICSLGELMDKIVKFITSVLEDSVVGLDTNVVHFGLNAIGAIFNEVKLRSQVIQIKPDMTRVVNVVLNRNVSVYTRDTVGRWGLSTLHTRMYVLPRQYDDITRTWEHPTSFTWAYETREFLRSVGV